MRLALSIGVGLSTLPSILLAQMSALQYIRQSSDQEVLRVQLPSTGLWRFLGVNVGRTPILPVLGQQLAGVVCRLHHPIICGARETFTTEGSVHGSRGGLAKLGQRDT